MIEDEGRIATGPQKVLLGRDFPEILVSRRTNERKVAVAFDHAGHEELPLPVDGLLRAFAADHLAAAGDRLDAVLFDDHLARIGLVVHAVPNRDVSEQE